MSDPVLCQARVGRSGKRCRHPARWRAVDTHTTIVVSNEHGRQDWRGDYRLCGVHIRRYSRRGFLVTELGGPRHDTA